MKHKAALFIAFPDYDNRLGFTESHQVMVFEDDRKATDWAVKRLADYGEIAISGGLIRLCEEESDWMENTPEARDDLLAYWQEGLDSSEYFHVYPIADPNPADV